MAPIVSISIVRGCGFSFYQRAKYAISESIGNVTGEEEPLLQVNRPGSLPNLQTLSCFFLAGATAGGFSAFLSGKNLPNPLKFQSLFNSRKAPFELTKNAMVLSNQIRDNTSVASQFRDSYAGKGTLGTAQAIVKNCGFRQLYCGIRLQLSKSHVYRPEVVQAV